ncbi:MAG: hypothetical protein LBK76_04455 [Verrucomicrobiales bacterium]|jgi:hypothetical protein|nr:hypothetical protein [Verrucomicrobiales bacterium]
MLKNIRGPGVAITDEDLPQGNITLAVTATLVRGDVQGGGTVNASATCNLPLNPTDSAATGGYWIRGGPLTVCSCKCGGGYIEGWSKIGPGEHFYQLYISMIFSGGRVGFFVSWEIYSWGGRSKILFLTVEEFKQTKNVTISGDYAAENPKDVNVANGFINSMPYNVEISW